MLMNPKTQRLVLSYFKWRKTKALYLQRNFPEYQKQCAYVIAEIDAAQRDLESNWMPGVISSLRWLSGRVPVSNDEGRIVGQLADKLRTTEIHHGTSHLLCNLDRNRGGARSSSYTMAVATT